MNLLRTSALSGIGVAVKMLTLLGINKILALYVGPVGYAALGQFQNAVQIITTFSSGAINNGVTKYTAEYSDDIERQREIWRTAGTICLAGSLFASILIGIFNAELAEWFFNDAAAGVVFGWLSISLVFFTFNALLLAILNGKKEIFKYVVCNICGSLLALLLTTLLAVNFGLYGALIALAVYQSFAFFVTAVVCSSSSWFKLSYLFGVVRKEIALKLGKFALMALVSAACAPISHIVIRNHLTVTLGLEAAGYWEAMWRLSSAYLLLVTTTLGVYYLPKFSELSTATGVRLELIKGYRLIIPVVAFGCLIIYWRRDFIINLLFSETFFPMAGLFGWQLFGDLLKVGSWLMAYLMLGKAMVFLYMSTEVIFAAVFTVLALDFTTRLGLEGVAVAHTLTYLVYWIVVAIMMWHKKVF